MNDKKSFEDKQSSDTWDYLYYSRIRIKDFIIKSLNDFNELIETDVSLLCIKRKDPIKYSCDSDIYTTDNFNRLFILRDTLFDSLPNDTLIHSHPIVRQSKIAETKRRCMIDAIKRLCETECVKEKNEIFVFGPNETDSFSIYVIFTVSHEILNEYFNLSSNNKERANHSKSLIRSCIHQIGREICSTKIFDDAPIDIEIDKKQTVKKAAESFISQIKFFNEYYAGRDIYDTINMIASLYYEKKENNSKIIFTHHTNKNITFNILFETPTKLNDHRKTRKLLELTSTDNFLITDGFFVYGIGKPAKDYNPNDENIFNVNILSHYTWEMVCNNNFLFKSKYNEIIVKSSSLNRVDLYDKIKRIFSISNVSILNNYYEIISRAIDDRRGAILIFSNNAKNETERLKLDEIKVSSFDVTCDNISLLTKIDGAVLMDSTCRCYAFGVILDGESTIKSDISRGSRYNSSLRYYIKESNNTEIMIVVPSDDQTIDIIPSLHSLISKNFLQEKVNEILNMDINDNTINEFNKRYRKIEEVKFYLNQDMCNTLNPVIEKANMVKEKQYADRCVIRILYDSFETNPEMNEAYYAENNYPARENNADQYIF